MATYADDFSTLEKSLELPAAAAAPASSRAAKKPVKMAPRGNLEYFMAASFELVGKRLEFSVKLPEPACPE
jgi:hypothetical protein